MKRFEGFPAGKVRLTPVPDQFFADVAPAIEDWAELQVVLYMFWFLRRQSGYPRYMTVDELAGEGTLMTALCHARPDEEPVRVLASAVELAIAQNILLALDISDDEGETRYLFMNTPQGRKAVREVAAGELALDRSGHIREAYVETARPSIFVLYENNIGLLQPMLAEELREAAETYPAQWVDEAFHIAVENNARSWRYVRAILERWERTGKDDGRPRYRGRS